jgi:hypothetical protein
MSASEARPRAAIVVIAGDRRHLVATVDHRVPCDLDLVHRLLWLRLSAHRLGCRLFLEDVDDDLHDLLDLVGAASSLGLAPD